MYRRLLLDILNYELSKFQKFSLSVLLADRQTECCCNYYLNIVNNLDRMCLCTFLFNKIMYLIRTSLLFQQVIHKTEKIQRKILSKNLRSSSPLASNLKLRIHGDTNVDTNECWQFVVDGNIFLSIMSDTIQFINNLVSKRWTHADTRCSYRVTWTRRCTP